MLSTTASAASVNVEDITKRVLDAETDKLAKCYLLNVFGVGVSCRNLYSFVVYLYVNGSGSITPVGEERANLSAVVYL